MCFLNIRSRAVRLSDEKSQRVDGGRRLEAEMDGVGDAVKH
jgi:hypothetical protein